MQAYHGTVKTGLRELRPFAKPSNNLEYACVYLSRSKALAALYIWNKPYKWLNFNFAEDGHIVYRESFPGALEEFYGGVAGSIYTCEGSFVQDKNTRIQTAVISRESVPVMEEDFIPDALARILEYERQGLLEIRRYEALTEKELAMEEKMIAGAIRRTKAGTPMGQFIQEKFPDLWAQYWKPLTAKPMQKEDVAFVVDLLCEDSVKADLHLDDTPRAQWEKILRKNLRDRDELNFILYRGGDAAGWLKLNGLRGDKLWISMLAVHPAHQGQGAGRFAVRHAEQIAREKGFAQLWIQTTQDNLPAQACYEKLGYTPERRNEKLVYYKNLT